MREPASRTVAVVHRAGALLGEGPVWEPRQGLLYWLDIHGRRLLAWSPAECAAREWPLPLRVSALAPCASGGFVAGSERGLVRFGDSGTDIEPIAALEPDLPGNRSNDGKTDAAGRFWIGTMDDSEQRRAGSLYRLDPDRCWHRVLTGLMVPNGPTFSPDGRWLYRTDSADRTVFRHALAADGSIGRGELFARFDEAHGYPDGMTTDREGCLWIAFWDGWCVRRFSPAAELLDEIDLPAQRPTSCAFGGPGLDTLYVTSATVGLPPEALARQPDAGSLFACRVAVPGFPVPPFAG